ncbi:DsrE/DsrF/TusD sulfur relay family protein [Fodinicurvata halophila]|uniref:DsrE/DsrF/TusD sulfur relay family protein n=1 Tax=Fodinicurvata halophila TaxID=1419723 RepID=A0ABV8ULL4_9PROT
MQTLIIINDPPYGTERLYNGLRLAHALLKRESDVTVFLMGDAVSGAKQGQKTPNGFYNIERMLKLVTAKGRVLLCGTCLDARGITEEELVAGSERSTMDALAEATEKADKTLVF